MFLGIVNNDEILVARDKLDKANSFGRAVIEHIIEQLIKHVNNEEKK
jgi:hypothetical protein